MTEQLITYPTAQLAKEKGFIELTDTYWEYYEFNGKVFGPTAVPLEGMDNLEQRIPAEIREDVAKQRGWHLTRYTNQSLPPWMVSRPSQDLLERWLREKHGILAGVMALYSILGLPDKYEVQIRDRTSPVVTTVKECYETFELAREAALYHALTLLP